MQRASVTMKAMKLAVAERFFLYYSAERTGKKDLDL